MTAQEMIRRFGLEPHVEGGAFRELFREGERASERPAHGVIYYLLDAHESSDFHVLDADEYWLYHAGPDIEIWWIGEGGQMHIDRLGLGEQAQPCVLMKGGTVFGARHVDGQAGPTLVSCITVPEFTYEHYRILDKAEVLAMCPEAEGFFAS